MIKEAQAIRKAMVAGMFYPGSAGELTKTLAELFSRAKKIPLAGRPLMLVAPHAGYAYSGLTAAYAYKQLSGHDYDTVVIISPSHTVFFQGASVFDGDAYETPLGPVPIDKELSQKIASINPSVFPSTKGHSGGGNRGEHALEVHLPFLQHILGATREATFRGPLDNSGGKNPLQAVGSARSYGRRYTLVDVLGLTTEEDDDGRGSYGGAPPPGRISGGQLADLEALIEEVGADRARFAEYLNVADLADLTEDQYAPAVRALEDKRRRAAERGQG